MTVITEQTMDKIMGEGEGDSIFKNTSWTQK